MSSRWGSALAAACVGLFALILAPAAAQVEWLTSLSPAATPIALSQQNVVAASDGSVYAAGLTSDGETNRVRLSRISATGAVQWVRWMEGGAFNTRRIPLWTHSDNSVSILSKDPVNAKFCMENFSAAGISQSRWCVENYGSASPVTQAPDGDFYYFDYSYYRAIKKVSPLGVERWSQVQMDYATGPIVASGIDSAGNYYEVRDFRLRTWSSVDGSKLNDVVIGGQGILTLPSIARAGRDLVLVRGTASFPNAVVTSIARNGSNGALFWVLNLVFPGTGPTDNISLAPADGDATYVIRTPGSEGDSHVAKVSAAGALIWQRHYSRARRIIEGGNGLVALRTDSNVGTDSTDTFMFPINASDGSLASPVIYSRADAFAPTDWFAVAGGVVGVVQGTNPFAPFASFPTPVAASMVFVESALPVKRWIVSALSRPPSSVQQGDCLMPRLMTSSPSSWWARTQLPAQTSASNWTAVSTSSGATGARTAPAAIGCGPSITQEGGQVVASSGSDRVKKFDASGATVWQATSAVNPSQSSVQPLVTVGAGGDTTYVVGSVVGRVSGAGMILFETETNQPNPRYVAVDSTNNTWVVSGTTNAVVSKVSPTGVLLWSNPVSPGACSNAVMSSLLTPSDEMLVATQSCGQGQIFRINAAGLAVSSTPIGGVAPRLNVQLKALQLDSAGNIYAGGCASSSAAASTGGDGFSFIASILPNGSSVRWTAQTDLFASGSECITSITFDSSDNLYAATTSGDTTRAPVLWSFTSAGVERWRHGGVLGSPLALATQLATDAAGKLIAIGEAMPGINGSREASVRRIDVASVGSSLSLKFLEVPGTPVGYREQFPVRIGLRTAGDVAANAASNIVVILGMQAGAGALDGVRTCTIVVGASECAITDVRYSAVGSGVTLSAGADGFATAVSAPISFTVASTTTTVSVSSPGPYPAFSIAHARAEVLGPPPLATQSITGLLLGPLASGNTDVLCYSGPTVGSLPWRECDFLVQSSLAPLVAQWLSGTSTYTGSASAPVSLSVIKVTPVLQVIADPSNTNVAGDRVRFRVSLLAPSGVNASRFVPLNSITVSGGGSCSSAVTPAYFNNKYFGDYILCDIPPPAVGALTVGFSFVGSDDLFAVGPITQSLVINEGAVIRVTGTSLPSSVSACSTTPGVICSVTAPAYNEWQCSGPVGMNGQVFLVSSPDSYGSYYFPSSPLRYDNVTGVTTSSFNIPFSYSSLACALDVDRDGTRTTMTDGILILRRMLGLADAALISGATHSCVPRTTTAIAQAINLSAYDIDGDGETRAETDGILLLRAMLGFSGDALIVGAVGANATRTTANDIQNFFVNSCGLSFN